MRKEYLIHKFQFLAEQYNKYNKLICAYCGRDDLIVNITPSSPNKATIDHIVPISRGGSWIDKDNMAVCCNKCNFDKADKIYEKQDNE